MVEFRRVVALRRWREKDARVVLAAWRASGQRLGTFARVHGFEDQRLRWWRDRLDDQPALLPVRVLEGRVDAATQPTTGSVMEIALETGRRVRVTPDFDEPAVLRLVRILEDEAC